VESARFRLAMRIPALSWLALRLVRQAGGHWFKPSTAHSRFLGRVFAVKAKALTPLAARRSPGPYLAILSPPAPHRQRCPEKAREMGRSAAAVAAVRIA
jgi:hypothetical protein